MAHEQYLVGVKRLELPAPWSQTTCATKLRYTPTPQCLYELATTQIYYIQSYLSRNFSYIFGYFLATLNISPKQNVVAYSLISNLSPLKRSAIVAVAFSSLDQEETSSSSFLTALTLFTGAEVALAVSNFLAFFFALFSFAS